jgi:hypothetical protein
MGIRVFQRVEYGGMPQKCENAMITFDFIGNPEAICNFIAPGFKADVHDDEGDLE